MFLENKERRRKHFPTYSELRITLVAKSVSQEKKSTNLLLRIYIDAKYTD